MKNTDRNERFLYDGRCALVGRRIFLNRETAQGGGREASKGVAANACAGQKGLK